MLLGQVDVFGIRKECQKVVLLVLHNDEDVIHIGRLGRFRDYDV